MIKDDFGRDQAVVGLVVAVVETYDFNMNV